MGELIGPVTIYFSSLREPQQLNLAKEATQEAPWGERWSFKSRPTPAKRRLKSDPPSIPFQFSETPIKDTIISKKTIESYNILSCPAPQIRPAKHFLARLKSCAHFSRSAAWTAFSDSRSHGFLRL